MPLLDDIEAYLLAKGADDGGTWPILKSRLPLGEQQAITIFETGGEPPTEMNRETQNLKFRLLVRGLAFNYEVTRSKWEECFDLLQDAREESGSPVLLPGIVYFMCEQEGAMNLPDANNRDNFITNFRVKRMRSGSL